MTIKGRYTDPDVWEKVGIHTDSELPDKFNLMNFPDWNIRSSDAVLNEGYWSCPKEKTVTVAIEPYQNIPEKYRDHQKSILPFCQQLLDDQVK